MRIKVRKVFRISKAISLHYFFHNSFHFISYEINIISLIQLHPLPLHFHFTSLCHFTLNFTLLLSASQINLLGFRMFAPILVLFIVFMVASAFSIDGMLRRDQTEEIDVSSPSSKRSKSPDAKKPSSKKSKPPHAKKPSKQSSETLRSVIERFHI